MNFSEGLRIDFILHFIILYPGEWMEKTVTVSIRIPLSQLEEIEEIACRRKIGRSAVIRELILEGLKAVKLKMVLDMLRDGKISVWKAAELTGTTYREMLKLLRIYNIPFPLSGEEILEELKNIERGQ